VAEFLGEANILMANRHKDQWTFQAVEPVPEGDKGVEDTARHVMIRPENTSLTTEHQGLLSGAVVEVRYLGIANRVTIETSAGPIIARVAAETTPIVGSVVGVRWLSHHMIPLDAVE
jgi:ABC-type Fe3+/spermidine/putrescine transport system ATPase subunit